MYEEREKKCLDNRREMWCLCEFRATPTQGVHEKLVLGADLWLVRQLHVYISAAVRATIVRDHWREH